MDYFQLFLIINKLFNNFKRKIGIYEKAGN